MAVYRTVVKQPLHVDRIGLSLRIVGHPGCHQQQRHVVALQFAPVQVDHRLLAGQFLEQSFIQIHQHVHADIALAGRLGVACLRHALEHARIEHLAQQLHVGALQCICAARRSDSSQYFGIEQRLRRRPCPVDEEFHRRALALRFNRLERRHSASGLVTRFLDTADDFRDRSQFPVTLHHQRLVHFAQARVVSSELGRRRNQHRHDTVDVAQAEIGGFDRVPTDDVGIDFRIQARIVVFTAEAQHRIVYLLRGQVVQVRPFVVAAHAV